MSQDCPDSQDHEHGLRQVHGSTHGPRLVVSLLVTIAFVIGEGIAGYRANSLALMAGDASSSVAVVIAGLIVKQKDLSKSQYIGVSFFRHIQFDAPNDQFSLIKLKWGFRF